MKVKVYRKDEEMMVVSQGGLNPNPVFPQWNAMNVYPNQYWGTALRRKCDRIVRMLYIENEYLKVGCNLETGGRVWSIYDKLAKRHAINYAPSVVAYNGGFGKSYTSGGLEVNYPLAHSPTTRLPREHSVIRNEDGSVSILISEYERKWRTRWSTAFTLRPGRAFLEMTVRLDNRTMLDTRYLYWGNCGIPLNDETEFIFPEEAGSMHGKEEVTFSWPMWRGKSQAFWKNVPEQLGLYMLNAQEPYFGYYDHGADYGLVHYSDLADLPGKKYWSWGGDCWSGKVGIPKSHLAEGHAYGEIQSGRIVIQEHLDRVPPGTEQCWTEYWYPFRDIGKICGAGRDVVVSMETDEKTGTKDARLKVNLLGTGTFLNARLLVYCGDFQKNKNNIALSPECPASCGMNVPAELLRNNRVVAMVVGEDGEVLGQGRLNPFNTRDSWTEISSGIAEPQACEAEAIFFEGEALARDWMNHDTRAKYEQALERDPGFSRAHLELAKLDIDRGNYDGAVAHLEKAKERDEDSVEIKYFLGVAFELSGHLEKALRSYELSCRYDYEARSRIRIAQIMMRLGDYHSAIRHLTRTRDIAGRLTKSRGLLAACLRLIKKQDEAGTEVATALGIDPSDPFLRIEQMRINGDKTIRKSLLEQVDGYEPPILEAAFDYGNAGLYKDALAALGVLRKPGPLSLFYKAWLENALGKADRAVKTLETACQADPVGHHAWRLEMIDVLQWAIDTLPKNSRPYYHLGNLKMARDCGDEAIALWDQAEKLGEKCYLLYSSKGYYAQNVEKDKEIALSYFKKATKLDPGDYYAKIQVGTLLNQLGRPAEAIRFLKKSPEMIQQSCVLAHALLTAYLARKQYTEFDEFCRNCDYHENWQLLGPHHIWGKRHVQQGLELMERGRYGEAIEVLLKGTEVPENIGYTSFHQPGKEVDVYYHVGCCHEMLGQAEQATEFWQRAVSIENPIAWEPAYWYAAWRKRYFQALANIKLGRQEQANIIFDAIESVARNSFKMPYSARRDLMDLVIQARTGGGVVSGEAVEVETLAES